MSGHSAWASSSLLAKVFWIIVLLLPVMSASDVYHSFKIRREVALGIEHALEIRLQVERQILAGKPVSMVLQKEIGTKVAIAVDPLHGVLTIEYLSSDIDGGGKTLVWVPIDDVDGRRALVEVGRVPKKIRWICLTSLSNLKSDYPWSGYRGTLSSKFAPANCRY